MRMRLTCDSFSDLRKALERGGMRETGGQLFGEQVATSEFVVTRLTVQRQVGTISRFVVDIVQAVRDAFEFFTATNRQFSRFNYIGEWHSHPSFAIAPSLTDTAAMQDLVNDTDFRGHFAVLMIARLQDENVSCGGWVFDRSGGREPVTIEVEHES